MSSIVTKHAPPPRKLEIGSARKTPLTPRPNLPGSHSVSLHVHVDDADAVIRRAVAAGAKLEREPADAFYGERSGVIIDPFGHRWNIGHSIEEVTPEEMQRRYAQASGSA